MSDGLHIDEKVVQSDAMKTKLDDNRQLLHDAKQQIDKYRSTLPEITENIAVIFYSRYRSCKICIYLFSNLRSIPKNFSVYSISYLRTVLKQN